ncbi:universal stress protein [Jeotgalibaca sp. MA1X17-3]|uniref:universal stress protein n=1 Tax=Jeotgalibaca sp. MA1X17-3 TaxID=2908211 RepID=UPI001F3AB4F2|nr:universal stress protein [Jeotgalibaca sp. MA1X17-3]UJF15550.1 universal stress protein [Jeotgalibaca sp. MA1X17-3]
MFGEYHNLLVPVDGSEQSKHSFKKALAIAKRNDATLHVLYVEDTRNVTVPRGPLDASDPVDEAIDSTFVDELVSLGEMEDVQMEKTLIRGNPLSSIASIIPEKLDIDLIIIGATGKGAVTRALVGSVSNHVVRNATCDVLVVR